MFDKEWLSSDKDLVAQYQAYLNRDEVIATMKKSAHDLKTLCGLGRHTTRLTDSL